MSSFSEDGQYLVVEAPAKINLSLKVKSRRPDGYHEIESLMQKIALADVIRLGRREKGIQLLCPGVDLPEDEDNLAFRAARVLLDCAGITAGVDIVLEKNIPVAAGLGGGSSDAAAVLLGLDRLFAVGLSRTQLMALAKPLGADVPFFVSGFAAARATGIGDCLTRAAALADCYIVLINPGFPVSTKWVYENLALTSRGNPFIVAPGRKTEMIGVSAGDNISIKLENDLEAVTIERYPLLAEIKEELSRDGADGVLMSGSGPTVFGLFHNEECAVRSFDGMRRKYKEAFLTRPFL